MNTQRRETRWPHSTQGPAHGSTGFGNGRSPRARIRRTFPLFTGLLAAAVLAACGQKTEAPGHPYCPLGNGLHWAYRAVTLGPGGSQVEARMETRVEGSETLNDKDYARFVTRTKVLGSEEPETVYFRSGPEGVFYVKGFQTDEPEQLYLPADPKTGMTWKVATMTNSVENRVDGFESVEIDGTKYECVRISSRGTLLAGPETVAINGVTYFAKGVGQVKSQMTTMGEGGERVPLSITLVDFSD